MKFTRTPRDPAAFPVTGDIEVRQPPALPGAAPTPLAGRLVPLVMVAAMAGMTLLYFKSANGVSRNPMFLLFPAMMAISVLGSAVYGSRGVRRTSEIDADRREYLRYLAALGECADRCARDQHDWLHRTHPAPKALWHSVGTQQMWQRRPVDPDFTEVRVGIGTAPPFDRLVADSAATEEHRDPVTFGALDELLQSAAVIGGVPVTLVLNRHRRITVCGEGAAGLVRAMICQLTVWHGPDHVRVLAVTASASWDWLKWLPHHYRTGCLGASALRFSRAERAAEVCDALPGCHVVVIADGLMAGELQDRDDVTVVELAESGSAVAGPGFTVVGDQLDGCGITGFPRVVAPDSLSAAQVLSCARKMSRFELVEGNSSVPSDWAGLVGIDDPAAWRPERTWSERGIGSLLRVPVGVGDTGAPVHLDLKESAQRGMGPHGLCIGATGSGKSEFLRTLVLGLISTHSPDDLNLILIDFKGGATFLGFDQVQHVSAVITNLAREAHLVERMREALAGELIRRQELLRAAGNVANIGEYRRVRAECTALDPMPALFIVVDEFSELLSQQPDFADIFVAIGRLGRSLGIHLLLASQRLEEGRLRGLETHLSYRICLKTFSATESRTVIGVPDAHQLPSIPGSGYLRTADGELIRFRAAFVSGPMPTDRQLRPGLFTGTEQLCDLPAAGGQTVLQSVVDRLAGLGASAHRVWLPPLSQSPVLADLLINRGGDNGPSMCVPIGLVDNPIDQRYDVLPVDLRGAGGNLAIVGGPRSGKSTALQTVLLALAATHSGRRISIYGIDLGEGALAALSALPQVGTVAGRDEPDLLRRIIAQLSSLISRRQGARSGEGGYRDGFGEVILAIDGWAALRRDFGDLEDAVTSIAAQGLSVGVHVVLTAPRWADLRPALKDQLSSRIELRLGDPAESEMDRRRALLLADRPPGRGITREGKEFVVALPRIDAVVGAADDQAPRIALLPTRVSVEALKGLDPRDFVIGLAADDLQPTVLDLPDEPLLMILGDTACGKTATLRALCRSIMSAAMAAQLLIVDFRRTLLGVVERSHLAGYAMSTVTVEAELAAVLDELTARLPGAGITQQQLRDRSWWSGPELYVMVDDYDLVADSAANPLLALLDLLPHARDIGLHVVIARRSGGAARAMFDPILARMRDLGATGLLMSASPEEGVLMGGLRSTPMPPGRAVIVRRAQPEQVVQIGWSEPP
ncbi:S-DNA-T family DNA segregation ATPase FtsK/SpoIIIE [Mycobacterium sp. MAA66]|uniref:type VII secretion protein EccCa n=1 Tax=Mycobacterium sp. MAA66 TaxID=3156297 RepID=UPI003510D751